MQLYDRLEPYVTEAEKSTLMSKLQQTEDWLYEEGEDETKGVYVNKLDELKKVSVRTILRVAECIHCLARLKPVALTMLKWDVCRLSAGFTGRYDEPSRRQSLWVVDWVIHRSLCRKSRGQTDVLRLCTLTRSKRPSSQGVSWGCSLVRRWATRWRSG